MGQCEGQFNFIMDGLSVNELEKRYRKVEKEERRSRTCEKCIRQC